jgi:MFS family permease
VKKLLVKIYSYRVFSEFVLLYPLYNVMFAERGGLDAIQISLLLAIWSIIILIIEIPSGALADKYSRRNLLGIAQAIRAIGYVVWIFWPTFEGFLLGLALWGVGRSLTSGTFEALVYDELKAIGKEEKYIKVIGRTESFAMFFGIGATLLAAPVFAQLGYEGILWGSVVAVICAGLIALTLPNKTRQQEVEPVAYTMIIRQAIKEVSQNNALLKIIIFGVFTGVLFRIFDEYASLIIKAGDVATVYVPIVSAMVFLPLIVMDFFAYKFEKMRQISFMILLVVAGLSLVLTGKYLGWGGLVAFAAFLLLIKVSITIFGAKVQHAIKGRTRATITSINGFGVEVSAVVGFLLFGLLVQSGSMASALMIIGFVIAAMGSMYLLVTRGRLVRSSLSKKK